MADAATYVGWRISLQSTATPGRAVRDKLRMSVVSRCRLAYIHPDRHMEGTNKGSMWILVGNLTLSGENAIV